MVETLCSWKCLAMDLHLVNDVSLEQPRDPVPALDGRSNLERRMMRYRPDQDALYPGNRRL